MAPRCERLRPALLASLLPCAVRRAAQSRCRSRRTSRSPLLLKILTYDRSFQYKAKSGVTIGVVYVASDAAVGEDQGRDAEDTCAGWPTARSRTCPSGRGPGVQGRDQPGQGGEGGRGERVLHRPRQRRTAPAAPQDEPAPAASPPPPACPSTCSAGSPSGIGIKADKKPDILINLPNSRLGGQRVRRQPPAHRHGGEVMRAVIRNLSIKGKLIAITMITSMVAVIVACAAVHLVRHRGLPREDGGGPARWWRRASPSTARPPSSSSRLDSARRSWAPCAPTSTSRPRSSSTSKGNSVRLPARRTSPTPPRRPPSAPGRRLLRGRASSALPQSVRREGRDPGHRLHPVGHGGAARPPARLRARSWSSWSLGSLLARPPPRLAAAAAHLAAPSSTWPTSRAGSRARRTTRCAR